MIDIKELSQQYQSLIEHIDGVIQSIRRFGTYPTDSLTVTEWKAAVAEDVTMDGYADCVHLHRNLNQK